MGVIKEKIEMAKKLLDIIYLKTIKIITELLNRRSRKGEIVPGNWNYFL